MFCCIGPTDPSFWQTKLLLLSLLLLLLLLLLIYFKLTKSVKVLQKIITSQVAIPFLIC